MHPRGRKEDPVDPRTLRIVAVAAAAASALLYYLIGFEVVDIGTSTAGEPDLLGFGLIVGTTYAGIGVVLALSWGSRWLLAAIGVVDAAVILGYFAMASLREPPFEAWGLLIKACQVVLLVAVGVLLFAHPMERQRKRHREDVLTTRPS
jgi:peptidoglycan/LPS O-acetylase OafA/YrhL